MSDLGFTHIALGVSDIDQSIAFYAKYAAMQVVHRRTDKTKHVDVAWISDLTRPFVLVLIQVAELKSTLAPSSHLGVACQTREEVDRLCNEARLENVLIDGPHDWGFPVGYWAFFRDPDGHTLEVSYGQEISFTVEQAVNKSNSNLTIENFRR
ncbi:VOC family protein [Tolypothrix sp. PCC 7910]|uniref:VOC family protein n=1 Tax=Tolypothrix sp. PCC 7910 TaxID=2099387 RepID=UPI00142770EF|nr:VOC family protein [Tolypothrix sp. PCC 7910]QIR37932.1 VOC family protein [Tolypothrix sp. PCC 7910]